MLQLLALLTGLGTLAELRRLASPEPITDLGLPEQDHFGPSLTNDPAVLFYSMGAGDDEDIWRATRDAPGGVFSGASPILELNTADMDGAPYIRAPAQRSRRAGSVGIER